MTDSPSLGKAFEKSRRINQAAGSRADVGAALRRDGLPQTAPLDRATAMAPCKSRRKAAPAKTR